MAWVGNGVFIWQIKQNSGGYPANSESGWIFLSNVIKKAGFVHCPVKVLDGSYLFNQTPIYNNAGTRVGYKDDILDGVFNTFDQFGIDREGWQYIYGYSPLQEAQAAVNIIRRFNLKKFYIDAESEYKKPGMGSNAEIYMKHLLQECPDVEYALCSYRFPNFHPEFPWSTFLKYLRKGKDAHAPQVYWQGVTDQFNPGEQLKESFDQLQELKELEFYPLGAAYGAQTGSGSSSFYWSPTKEQMINFALNAKDIGIKGVSWWELGSMLKAGNLSKGWLDIQPYISNQFIPQDPGDPGDPDPGNGGNNQMGKYDDHLVFLYLAKEQELIKEQLIDTQDLAGVIAYFGKKGSYQPGLADKIQVAQNLALPCIGFWRIGFDGYGDGIDRIPVGDDDPNIKELDNIFFTNTGARRNIHSMIFDLSFWDSVGHPPDDDWIAGIAKSVAEYAAIKYDLASYWFFFPNLKTYEAVYKDSKILPVFFDQYKPIACRNISAFTPEAGDPQLAQWNKPPRPGDSWNYESLFGPAAFNHYTNTKWAFPGITKNNGERVGVPLYLYPSNNKENFYKMIGYTQPETRPIPYNPDQTDPGNGGTDPGNGGTDPGNGGTDPGTGNGGSGGGTTPTIPGEITINVNVSGTIDVNMKDQE